MTPGNRALHIEDATKRMTPAAKGDGVQLKSVLLLCKHCQNSFHLAQGGTRIKSTSLGRCGSCLEERAKRAGS